MRYARVIYYDNHLSSGRVRAALNEYKHLVWVRENGADMARYADDTWATPLAIRLLRPREF